MYLPSGDHSYAATPVGADVITATRLLSGSIVATCGPPWPITSIEMVLPSGSQRNRGAGSAGVKMRCVSASRFGVPPVALTMNSAGSCALRSTDGVDTV